jgi:hypothetical protein
MTISIGLIRFLRKASRSSATVLASTPALRAPRAAVLAVPLAALRAFCCRPRALPPLLAAALREAALRLEDELPEEEALREDELREDDPLREEALREDDPLRDEALREEAPLREEALRADPLREDDPLREAALREDPLREEALREAALFEPDDFAPADFAFPELDDFGLLRPPPLRLPLLRLCAMTLSPP